MQEKNELGFLAAVRGTQNAFKDALSGISDDRTRWESMETKVDDSIERMMGRIDRLMEAPTWSAAQSNAVLMLHNLNSSLLGQKATIQLTYRVLDIQERIAEIEKKLT